MRSDRFSGKKRYILLFVLGMLVFLYPTFSNFYYDYISQESSFNDISKYPEAAKGSAGNEEPAVKDTDITISEKDFQQTESDPSMKPLLSKELEYLKAYNKKLWTKSKNVTDPFGKDDGSSAKFSVSKDPDKTSVFAYIKIERTHQTLPVYLGATDEHLRKGVAVIQGTSIPVGGENTNSVIAGHTGTVRKFFTYLSELKPGDLIEIRNRWETIYYKVTGNKLIWPDQEEYLAVVAGKDMITLLTCYHGTPENDRLLVFAERYYPEENKHKQNEENLDSGAYSYLSKTELQVKPWYEKPETYVLGIAVILLCLFIYTFFRKTRK